MASKDELGRRGEALAARFLEDAGYRVLERNWRCARGEIDIIAQTGNTIVFVEVKTRSGLAFGHPFEAITATKLARLRMLAGSWCADHTPGAAQIRLDAIAVIAPRRGSPTIEHLLGVF
ncbi:putative endonuclease [Mycetocola sp. CAN_C7]|uniref:YraN family protein n=1 Tax=Mycetocola sp. CAN_C7 TaxID=2787724 RepID=UPI0018CB6A1C